MPLYPFHALFSMRLHFVEIIYNFDIVCVRQCHEKCCRQMQGSLISIVKDMAAVTFKGTPVKLCGDLPATGTQAPRFGGVKGDLTTVHLPDFLGKRVILNIFPSLDTPVCAASVRRFNKEASSLDNTVVLCVSKDLPFAQSRFCSTEGLDDVVPLSVFRCHHFDERYGLVMAEGPLKGLLARAVIIIDEEGKIVYEQLVPEVTDEPDYDAALKVLK